MPGRLGKLLVVRARHHEISVPGEPLAGNISEKTKLDYRIICR